MTELPAIGKIKRVQIEAVVIRADGTRQALGVVSDSKWRRWDPRGFMAGLRTRKANRGHG